jgi:hypothetical protein
MSLNYRAPLGHMLSLQRHPKIECEFQIQFRDLLISSRHQVQDWHPFEHNLIEGTKFRDLLISSRHQVQDWHPFEHNLIEGTKLNKHYVSLTFGEYIQTSALVTLAILLIYYWDCQIYHNQFYFQKGVLIITKLSLLPLHPMVDVSHEIRQF